ncbi:OmpA family protein [Hymenobacter radiodurans]|uniref:OmpA family protein n=1 Tax=Hymenobacter radiodurans TaxID=2496028 RepID=UPI001404EEE2|nr:OmpA family protein [Hymenobacter radiodurans]
MKLSFWCAILALVLAGPVQAQSLAGEWQGVETDPYEEGNWPAVLRLQQNKDEKIFGVLYQEVGGTPAMTVTFEMQGARTENGATLTHTRKLSETGQTPFNYWCDGSITFTYDPNQEKLTGNAAYRPVGDCDMGTFTLYRIKLKSPSTVPTNTESTIRVSGQDVRWYADPDLKQRVATGNTYRTKLSKTTTFYLKQGYFATSESSVVPITINVGNSETPKPAAAPAPARVDTARPAAPILAPSAKPIVLPTVLFKLGTPDLLPTAIPALDQLAAELKARPTLKLRVSGHTDKIGEPQKNQVLSVQRAEAVKSYLVKSGIAAERISTTGYGDKRPLYRSPDARNRRVEVEATQ